MDALARCALTLAILALALPAGAAQWKQLGKSRAGELWIDQASITHSEGEAKLDYRVDFARPQRELETNTPYRSVVSRAIIRCASRTISMGPSTAYEKPRATGKKIGEYPPAPEEVRFQPIEPHSSDEDLWRHVCKTASVTPKK